MRHSKPRAASSDHVDATTGAFGRGNVCGNFIRHSFRVRRDRARVAADDSGAGAESVVIDGAAS